jgi:flagellar protein FlgJ
MGGGGSFPRAFAEVQGEVASEVARFLAEGGGGSATVLSAEGSMWRARSAAALMGSSDGADVDGIDTPGNAPVVDGAAATEQQQAFLNKIAPWAREAAGKLGVAPELVAAHAALESGWGQRPIPGTAAGGTSHNLFGIKAGASWTGAVSQTATTEYVHGTAIATSARFRAYPDAQGAFRDYAQMLLDNPRFKGALNVGGDAHAFAKGLVRGGYATDPAYADKLARTAAKLQGIKG